MSTRPQAQDMAFTKALNMDTADGVFRIPYELCVRMANEATALAVSRAPKRTGLGSKGLYPIADEGMFGVGIRDWAYYMYYQEMGVKPFTMWSLEGKTIPMHIGGATVFRKAVGVGKPKQDKYGHFTGGIKWRYAGMEPKNFIRDAVEEVVSRYGGQVSYIIGRDMLAKRLGSALSVN